MVVDRQVVRAGSRDRILESVVLTLKHGDGTMIVATLDEEFNWHDRTYTSKFACPNCHTVFAELEPRTFSFNSPYGACPTCGGMGVVSEDRPLSLRETPSQRGTQSDIDDSDDNETESESKTICPECHGDRLGPAGRSVRLSGLTLPELLRKTIAESASFFEKFACEQSTVADDPNLGPILAACVRGSASWIASASAICNSNAPPKHFPAVKRNESGLAGCVGGASARSLLRSR